MKKKKEENQEEHVQISLDEYLKKEGREIARREQHFVISDRDLRIQRFKEIEKNQIQSRSCEE